MADPTRLAPKVRVRFLCINNVNVADPTRLELATSAVTGQRSNQLSYESTSVIISHLIHFYQVQKSQTQKFAILALNSLTFLEFGMLLDRRYQDYSLPLAAVAPIVLADVIESTVQELEQLVEPLAALAD